MTEQRRDDIAKLEALHAQRAGGRVFIHLAEAYRRAGEMERARAVVEEGLSNHGEYASARVVHGRILRELAKPDEAAEEFRAALDIDPHNLVALRALGELRREAGDPSGAREYFQQVLLLDPGDEDVDRAVRDLEASAGPQFEADDAGRGEDVDLLEVGATAGLGEAGVDAVDNEEEAWAAESWGEVDLSTGQDSEPEEAGSEEAEQEDAVMVGEWATLLPDSEEEPQTESGEAAAEDVRGTDSEETGDLRDIEIEEIDPAIIEVEGIEAQNVEVEDVDVEDVDVEDIDVEDIDVGDVDIEDVELEEVDAGDVDAGDIEVGDVDVEEADVEDREDVELEEDAGNVEHVEDATASATVEPASEERGAEVATETMADLYARQGLHEYAAEVYQKLLDARPGDVGLEEKLEESRRQLAASPAGQTAEPAAEPAAESESELRSEVEAEDQAEEEAEREFGSEGGIVGSADAVSTEPEEADLSAAEFVEMSDLTAGDGGTDAATPSDAAEGGDRQTVDDYFSRLLSWRPAEEEFTRTLDLSRDAEYLGGGPAADGAAGSRAVDAPDPDSQEAAEAAADSRDADEAPAESESGDEDLEVFRSWLQSLKR